MEPSDTVLSDVHVDQQHTLVEKCSTKLGINGSPSCPDVVVFRSRFQFIYDNNECGDEASDDEETDEDGDLIVKRKKRMGAILISHALDTRLEDVGLQVWSGALLLCDFLLGQQGVLEGHTVLELGGGAGIASVVAAMAAKNVICTDVGEEVLSLCQKNLQENSYLFKAENVLVRELDWFKTCPRGNGPFSWGDEDLQLLSEVDIIIAADVIYSDDLTDAFFSTVCSLMSRPPNKTIYIALEKRLNFTLTDLDIACPAYSHFQDHLYNLSNHGNNTFTKYTVSQVDPVFKQYFQYTRTKYLEIWKVEASVHSRDSGEEINKDRVLTGDRVEKINAGIVTMERDEKTSETTGSVLTRVNDEKKAETSVLTGEHGEETEARVLSGEHGEKTNCSEQLEKTADFLKTS